MTTPKITEIRDPNVTFGTINLVLGSSDIEIGAVEIKDGVTDVRVNVVAANAAASTATPVMRVQHVDDQGSVLRQSTLASILSALSGAATEAKQDDVISALSGVSTEVTQASILAALSGAATEAKQDDIISALAAAATETTLASVLAALSGASTEAKQDAIISALSGASTEATLADILAELQASAPSASVVEATLLNAATSPGAGTAVDVSGRTRHTIQHIITGEASVETRVSLDGTNWAVLAVQADSGVLSLLGPYRYISANYRSGTGTVTSLLISIF